MHILISENSVLSLEDVDNFKGFSIKKSQQNIDATAALSHMAEAAEDNHYWIDADEVVKLSDRAADSTWVDSFWAMLKAVESYGYSNLQQRKVKAHLE